MQGRKVRGEWRAVNGAKCRWAVWRRLRARCVHAIKPAHHCLERRVERDNSALKKLLSPATFEKQLRRFRTGRSARSDGKCKQSYIHELDGL